METTNSNAPRQAIGEGSTQLLCETFVVIKPPMSKIIKEVYDVEVTDFTLFNDKVIFMGTVEKTFYYNHPHLNNNKRGSSDSDSDSSDNGDELTDEFKCLDGWGQLDDYYGGIVHFHNQIFQFKGTVEIPGVVPGDSIEVVRAEVAESHPFEAVALASDDDDDDDDDNNDPVDENGLIHAGRQMFKINVVLCATRGEAVSGETWEEHIINWKK